MTEEHKARPEHESVEQDQHAADTVSPETEAEALNETPDTESAPEAPTSEPPAHRRSWALPVSAVALAVAILGTGWTLMHTSEQQSRLNDIDTRIGHLDQQRQGILDEARHDSDQSIAPIRDRVGQTEQGLKDVKDKVKQLSNVRPPDGRYVEIEYQLRLAQQRLGLEGDTKGALLLLNEADQRLGQINDPNFLPVRRAIADARTALDNVHAPDVDGLYIQLASEIQLLDQLPLAQSAEPVQVHADSETPYSGSWRDQLSRLFEQFKDLIIIKRHDRGLEALVTPGQESTLRQNLRLLLSQAQSGLLRQSPEVYTHSLKEAHWLIERYFLTDNEAVKATLARLDTLSQQQVRPALPDIGNTLEQWHQALARHQTPQGE